MSDTTRAVYDVFKSLGAPENEAMNAAFLLTGPERTVEKLRETMERTAVATEGMRSDFARLGAALEKQGDTLVRLQVQVATMSGQMKWIGWLGAAIFTAVVLPQLVKAFGH